MLSAVIHLVRGLWVGWVMAREFQMCEKEKLHLEDQLASHFDLRHFRNSMLVCPATAKWLEQENDSATTTVHV